MITLKVAGFSIAAEGFENDFFLTRTKEYRTEIEHAELSVRCTEKAVLSKPEGEEFAAEGERHWLKNGDSYAFYDSIFLPQGEVVIACVTANADWSEVSGELAPVEQWNGADYVTRSFHFLGEAFRWFVCFHDAVVFHSSCLKCDGKALAFSAPSGTGKSTHTGLWKQFFPITMINDDSPCLKKIGEEIVAFGTPWSGKTDINHNISAPLHCIVFLEQAKENVLTPISGHEFYFRLMREIRRSVYRPVFDKTLEFFTALVTTVPAFLLRCTISKEAAELTHALLNEFPKE